MGDFEDIFGAGADVVDIIDGISRQEMRYQRQAARRDAEKEQCRNPKVAASFYDLTGQTWLPAETALEHLLPEDEARIMGLSQRTLQHMKHADPLEQISGTNQELVVNQAYLLLRALQETLKGDLKSLHEVEYLLTLVVQSCDFPAILVRMTGLQAGYAGSNLSTHAIILDYGVYIARFGDLTMQGPFPDDENDISDQSIDYYRSLSQGGPGRKILAISGSLIDAGNGIVDAQSWQAFEQAAASRFEEPRFSEERQTLWDDLRRVAGEQERQGHVLRSWTDGELHHLIRRLKRLIAPLIDDGYEGRLLLRAGLLGESYLKLSRQFQLSPREQLIDRLLRQIDVRHFVLSTRYLGTVDVPLLSYPADAPSMHEKLSGKEELLAMLGARGYDRAAVSAFLEAEDHAALARLVDSTEDLKEVRRKRAEARRVDEAAAAKMQWHKRTGMTDLPY